MTQAIDDLAILEQLRNLPTDYPMAFGISAFHNNGTHFVIPRVQAAFQTRSTQQAVPTEANIQDTVESETFKDFSNIESKCEKKLKKSEKRKVASMVSQIDHDADDEHQSQKSNTKLRNHKSTENYEPVISTKRSNENRRPLEAVVIPAMDSNKISGKKRKRANGTSPTHRDILQSMESFGEPTNINELDVRESHKEKKKKRKISGGSSSALNYVSTPLKKIATSDIDDTSIDKSPKKEKNKKHDNREAAEEVEAAKPQKVIVISEKPKATISKRKKKKLRRQLLKEAREKEAVVSEAQPALEFIAVDETPTPSSSKSRKKAKNKANQFSQESHTDIHTIPVCEAPFDASKVAVNTLKDVKFDGQATKRAEKMFMIPKSLLKNVDMEEESWNMKEFLNHRKVQTDQDMAEDSIGNESDTSSHLSVSSSNPEDINDRPVPINFQPSSAPRPVKDIPILPPIKSIESVAKIASTRPSQSTHSEHNKTPIVFSETPILPPKKSYPQTATRSIPSIDRKSAKPRSPKSKSKKKDVDENSSKLTHKGSGLTRSSALPDIRAAESAESANTSSTDEPETFSQAIKDLKASSQKMQTLFSPSPGPEDDPSPNISRILSASQSPTKSTVSTSTIRTRVREIIAARDFTSSATKNDENTISDDWETSAKYQGRIRSSDTNQDDGETDENIAFSSVYMVSNNNILRLSNTLFQKQTLAPGEGWVIGRDENEGMGMAVSNDERKGKEDIDRITLKVCTVIEGKVNVQLAGEKFLLSKGGVWRVRGREECVVRNAYGDVHMQNGKKRSAVVVCFGVE